MEASNSSGIVASTLTDDEDASIGRLQIDPPSLVTHIRVGEDQETTVGPQVLNVSGIC
jgi:hypothetical protein